MYNQLVFKFPTIKKYFKKDFYVSESNQEAYNFVDSWPKWIKKIVNIYGDHGSGKTHLSSILQEKTKSLLLNSKHINNDTFKKIKLFETIIIEDYNQNIDEEVLYSIFNLIENDNKYFLITSLKPVSSYNFELPDLRSRLNSCIMIGLKIPSDSLVKVIITKNFSDRQIVVDKKHIDYIIKRVDRSYAKISKFVGIIDNLSLKMKKPLNFKIIKETIKLLDE